MEQEKKAQRDIVLEKYFNVELSEAEQKEMGDFKKMALDHFSELFNWTQAEKEWHSNNCHFECAHETKKKDTVL